MDQKSEQNQEIANKTYETGMKESPTKMNKKGSFMSKLKPYKNMGFDGDLETWESMEF